MVDDDFDRRLGLPLDDSAGSATPARGAAAAGGFRGLNSPYGKVTVTWWSHEMKGLHKNDFILAARTDEVAS